MSKKGSKAISKAEEKLKAKAESQIPGLMKSMEAPWLETLKPNPNPHLEGLQVGQVFGVDPKLGVIEIGKPTPENPIEYVRFQSPCPPTNKMEPVYEIKTNSTDIRYLVEEIWDDKQRVYWKLKGQVTWTPEANVQYARPLCK